MLSATNLSFERHFQPVFEPLGFQLGSGGVLLISGANGCGKTTLIRLLAGILHPSSGEIECAAKGLVYVGHLLGIKDDLSVTENLRFMQRFQAQKAETDSNHLVSVIKRVGLTRVASQVARNLSAGQRKRCALARLLFGGADLWLLDEPYSNLDDQGIAMLDQLLQEHAERGGACVMATHGSHRPALPALQELRLVQGVHGT